ncbi:YibE/F family protein [Evansella sp. AB-P1]|uniref:YibE/F family protein n=1 Tax=Evansella sp. AB-P1 TaxID=3037653 RepID=UPI00241CA2CA|nr:YibE/F family protein [Evansella sp. AB-P1]MDG5788973.1 YibE/F family protein [Evansella sp. AB-P1]
MKIVFSVLLFISLFFVGAPQIEGFSASNYDTFQHTNQSTFETLRTKGKVVEIIEENEGTDDFTGMEMSYQRAIVEVLSGDYEGETIIAESYNYPGDGDLWVKENDTIIIQLNLMDGNVFSADIVDYTRDFPSYLLIGLLIALLLLFGKKQGVRSILTLGLTLWIIFQFMVPYLFAGYNPVVLAIITGTIVTVATFVIISGFSRKTLAAITGTIGGLISAAVISIIFSKVLNLSGLHGEEERMLYITTSQDIQFDFQGILLAGIIIGALGAVMDVAISIASSMDEVWKTDKLIKKKQLFTSGMNVGRDIMGTMANTLILAYVGAALPILLVLYGFESPMSELIHMEFLAVEILRTVAGSIGLILSIPITALIAAMLIRKNEKSEIPEKEAA